MTLLEWVLIQFDRYPYKKRKFVDIDTCTQKKMPYEDEDRDQGDSSESQGVSKFASKPQGTRRHE